MKQSYQHTRIEIHDTVTLLKWSSAVQYDLAKPAARCDYQDDYAHAGHETIDKAFNDATQDERRLILCAVYNTMAYDEVERLLLVRAKAVRQAERAELYRDFDQVETARTDELDRREATIFKREITFQEMKKPYHKRLADQRRQIDQLHAALVTGAAHAAAIRKERDTAKLDALEYEIKASRYDAIREALDLLPR